MIAGVDGCPAGWLLTLERDNGTIALHVVRSAAELLVWPDLSLVVIDVPIGLTERTPRRADMLARQHLGRRGCTVFPAPYRVMLTAAGKPPDEGQAEALAFAASSTAGVAAAKRI